MKPILSILALAITLFTALNAINANANWGRGSQVSCIATDNGWEEHWGGHGSCQECKAKHGRCTETCSRENYSCKAEGVNYQGFTESFEAYGSDEYDTRNEALDRCYLRGATNCHYVGCSSESEVVSRRTCN